MNEIKTNGLALTACRERRNGLSRLPAALAVFMALAALAYVAFDFQAMPVLLLAGAGVCVGAALWKGANRALWVLPALLALVLLSIFGRELLRNGFGRAWNDLRELWAVERGVLLPLAGTDGSGLWLIGVLGGILLAALSLLLAVVCPMGGAVLLVLAAVAASLVRPEPLLLVPGGVAVWLLTRWEYGRDRALPLYALGAALVVGLTALTLGGAAGGLAQRAAQTLHSVRYETGAEPLPEGDLSQPLETPEEDTTVLSVRADAAQSLYLRGFVGDSYENEIWTPLDSSVAAEEKDLFYWLHASGFYPQSQLALAAKQMETYTVGSVTVQNLSGCSLYRYEPCAVLPQSAGTDERRLQPSAVTTTGWNGQRGYSYQVVLDVAQLLPELLETLQSIPDMDAYRQAESAYRDFVYTYALSVPESFRSQMGELLTQCRAAYPEGEPLTREQAQVCALAFLERCFDGDPNTVLPLMRTANGTTYQYATVAALALRYYGIPARYAEGYIVTTRAGEAVLVDASAAGAWVEVYQDGVGWLPIDLTPGMESLSAQKTEDGIRPVGAGQDGIGDGLRVTEGQELEQDEQDQDDTRGESPEGGQRTGLLRKPAFWLALIGALLLLLAAAIVLRRELIRRRRQREFDQEDSSQACAALFSHTASVLEVLGLRRAGGSMLELCPAAGELLGEQYADELRKMTMLNARALFSSHGVEDRLDEMRAFREQTLGELKTHVKPLTRFRLKWLKCLY